MINFIVFLIFVLSIVSLYKALRKTSSIPKGLKELPHENGLPIIGIFHQIGKLPICIHLSNLVKKHGPLFRVRLGMRDVVVLNNYDVIKKTLKDDGDNFAGRFKIRYFREITRNVGIIFHDGQMWAKQRAFILNVFHDFGVTTSRYLDVVQEECNTLLKMLEQMNEKKTTLADFTRTSIANVISKVILNKTFDFGSEELQNITQFITEIGKTKGFFQILSLMFPFLDESTLFFKIITMTSSEWRLSEKMNNHYQKEISKHLKELDFNSEGEDLTDRFLIKQREMERKIGNVDSFTDWQLVRNITELYIAGFESLSTTLEWSIMFMSRYPDIQNKVYLEIVDKIGNRDPTMNDKVNMVYTQAVMDEIYRMSSVAPLGVSHQTFDDCNVDGFFIPKKTVVFPNLYACHHDPQTWKNPMEFNPERFLSWNNNGELKYTPLENLIPFGIGKRQCLGESLARMESFIFFTRILQRFKVGFCEEISEKKYQEVLLANDGIIRQCSIQSFIFINRN